MSCKCKLLFELCNNSSFKDLFKVFGFMVLSPTFYRTELLNEEADRKMKLLISSIINKPFYLMLDETINRKQENILNILVGVLNTDIYTPSKIIYSGAVENTKTETLVPIIDNVIHSLLKHNYNKNILKVFLSDEASYCRKLFNLKYWCYHVICVCHNLHNFSEHLRKRFKYIDTLICFLKRILIKNKTNKSCWKSSTNLALPKWSILTRWGTWISCGTYLSENFEAIKNFLNKIKNIYSHEVETSINNNILANELQKLLFYVNLPKKIQYLEQNKIELEDLGKCYLSVSENLMDLIDRKEFDRINLKNPDLNIFLNFVDENHVEKLRYFRWLPLSTAAVERSFSVYNRFLTEERTNLKPDTIFKMFLLIND